MTRKVFLCSIVSLLAINASAYQLKTEKEFVGTINNTIKIRMKLVEKNKRIEGTYLYERIGKNLKLNGTMRDETDFYLNEFDEQGKKTGIFEGSFISQDWIEGVWAPGEDKNSQTFSAWNPEGRDVPTTDPTDKITGQYKRVDERGKTDSQTAGFNVWLLRSGRVRLQGYSYSVGNVETGNVNAGSVDGIFNLTNSRVNYTGTDSDDTCRFTVQFAAGALIVSGDNGQCGGLNVNFNGKYRRVGPPKVE
jgi:hypothetical protein